MGTYVARISGKNAIAVGNWFGDGWRPNARRSIAAIARHWNLPVIELTQVIGAGDGFTQKLHLDEHCAEFDRVIWLDRDVLVRRDCPNLLEIVAEGQFGCVSSHQEPWHIREDARSLALLFEENGETYDFTIDHLNTGVMVFEPARHAGIFAAARRYAACEKEYLFFDEPWLSLAAKQSGRRQFLDKTFNRCGLANLDSFTPEMFDYVWHFCGVKSDDVNAQIDATIWQSPAAQSKHAEVARSFAEARAQAESWTSGTLTDRISHIPSGWHGHQGFAVKLVQALRPAVVVDLGVDRGFSTFAFALPGIGTVYGIDSFKGDDYAGHDMSHQQVLAEKERLGLHNVVIINAQFPEAAKSWNRTIDILHIDGDHAYDSAKRDFETWSKFVGYQGVILIHDIVTHPDEVGRFYAELPLPKFAFPHSQGLGVICRDQQLLNQLTKL